MQWRRKPSTSKLFSTTTVSITLISHIYVQVSLITASNCLCMVRAKKKCPDFLSTYRYFLSTLEGTSEGTSVGTYCTVRLKHITCAKKFSREASSCTYTTHQRFCRQMSLLSSCHIASFSFASLHPQAVLY